MRRRQGVAFRSPQILEILMSFSITAPTKFLSCEDAMDYTNMTAEELDAALVEVNTEVDTLKELARKLRQLRDAKLAADSAKAKFDAMSEAEKAAMTQQIQVHSISAVRK